MKRLMLASLFLAAFGMLGARAQTACQPALKSPPLIAADHLTTATNPTAPPMQYIDESGKLVGLDVDFGEAISAHLCLKTEWVKTEFVTMIPGLKGSRFDMVDTFMYYTPERAAQVHMIPYGAATLAIIVPKANGDAIPDLAYFSGKPFGTQLGSTDDRNAHAASDALVKAGKAPIDIHTFPNYGDILQALSAGQLDGALIGTPQAFYFRNKGQTFFRIATTGLFPHAEALAFGDAAVAQAVADTLNKMKADGSFDKVFDAYHHCTLPPPYTVTTGPIPDPVCPPFNG
jgi:polar amino acid transport system substrate-binding protein